MTVDYLQAMVRRQPPAGSPVVPGSTPVVAFGDPARAEVATLAINPSAREFVEDGELLTGPMRRLATLESLGAERLDRVTDTQVAEVVADCETYFQRQPYRRWFDPLDELLRVGADASYYDGSACHLDLVQWATEPVWGKIPDPGIRRALLEDGVPHLRAQLAQENVRLILLNGRQVLRQVVAVGLAELDEVGDLPLAGRTCRLYLGTGGGVRWVGWSANLQSSFGVTMTFREDLGAWLAEVCQPLTASEAPATTPTPVLDKDGHLPRGLRLAGKAELAAVLSRWLADSTASTLGDVGAFGGRSWLIIDVGDHEVVLNADTKRSAIESFVRSARSDRERPWRVVANRRGKINKVLPGPASESLPGWYAYLTRPLTAEKAI